MNNPFHGSYVKVTEIIDLKTNGLTIEDIRKSHDLNNKHLEDYNEYYTLFKCGILIKHKLSKTKPIYICAN
jgi:hypothetical protein